MENPVLQLGCESKHTGGLTIRHENCNPNNAVSSSINEIFFEILSNKSSNKVQNQPSIYLPLAEKI